MRRVSIAAPIKGTDGSSGGPFTGAHSRVASLIHSAVIPPVVRRCTKKDRKSEGMVALS